MERKSFIRVLFVYFLVSVLVLVSNLVSLGAVAGIAPLPSLLSVLLLIPLWAWHKRRVQKTSLSKQIQDEPKGIVLSWILALFLLALVVRIPSVMLFGMAYEKTPLIYLVVLSIVVLMKNDASLFGFKTEKFGRALLLGALYYAILGLLPYVLMGVAFYVLEGQLLIEGFNPLPFLFTVPFMTFCVGISEEGLFRGYMQTRLGRVYSQRRAIFLQALLFGLWHFVWHVSPLDFLGMLMHVGSSFMVGLLFGYFYGISGNLTPIVLTHGLIDSFPRGFVPNQIAYTTLQSMPFSTQLLILLIPYAISFAVAFASTRFLIKITLGVEKSNP